MSEVMRRVFESVPNLKSMDVDLNPKGESPNALILKGVLQIGEKMYNTKETTIKEQLNTNFIKQDLEFESQWLQDPLKLRDEKYRAEVLKARNDMIGEQQKAINEANLSKDVRNQLSESYKMSTQKSMMKLGKTLIEQDNAVELEKRSNVVEQSKMLLNTPTQDVEERNSRMKNYGKSVDLLTPFKTEEEVNNLKITGFLESSMKQDFFDFEKVVVNPDLKTADKLDILKNYKSKYLNKDNIKGLAVQAQETMNVDSKTAEELITGLKDDIVLQIDKKIFEYKEKIKKAEIKIANDNKRQAEEEQLEDLKIKKKEIELTESKIADLNNDVGAINTSMQANNELRAINIATGESRTPFQFFSDDRAVIGAYGKSILSFVSDYDNEFKNVVNVIDDRIVSEVSNEVAVIKSNGGSDYDVLKNVLLPLVHNQFGDDRALTEMSMRQMSQRGIIKDDRLVQMVTNHTDPEVIETYARNMNLTPVLHSIADKTNFINGGKAGASGELTNLMVIHNEDGSIDYGKTSDLTTSLVGMITNGTLPFDANTKISTDTLSRAYKMNRELFTEKIVEQKELITGISKRKFNRVRIKKDYLDYENNVRINSDPQYTEHMILKARGPQLMEVKAGKIEYVKPKEKYIKPKGQSRTIFNPLIRQ